MVVNEEIRELTKASSIARRDRGPFIDFLSPSVGNKERVPKRSRSVKIFFACLYASAVSNKSRPQSYHFFQLASCVLPQVVQSLG